ncbi:MAG: DotA/TraY family protein [Desulfovibrio sp.]|nr:DotA/TraY family protein [Desulfovibrio sp.]
MAADLSEQLVSTPPPETDLAREVLATIFGDHWWNLTASGSSQGIFELLMTLNVVCAAIIAWLLLLNVLVGTTGAATDGAALGGKYRNPWLPLRLAFAMAAVTPVHNGLCAMQLLLLSLVAASINLANGMQNTATEWIAKNSTLAAIHTASAGQSYAFFQGTLDTAEDCTGAGKTGGKTLAVQILQNLAFLSYLHDKLGCDTPRANFAEALHESIDPETGNLLLHFSPTGRMQCARGYVQKEPEAFGGFLLAKNAANDVTVALPLEERRDLLKNLIRQVEATNAHSHFAQMQLEASEMRTVVQDRARVQACGVAYALELATFIRGKGTRHDELNARLASYLANMQSLGWFALGSHYFSLATLEQECQLADDVQVHWLEPRFRSFAEMLPASFATQFWPRINEASYLGDTPSQSLWDKLCGYLAPFTGLTKRFAVQLGESPDALLAMVSMARWVSATCQSILVACEAAKLAAIGGSKLLTKNAASRVADFFTGGGEACESVLATLVQDLSFFLKAILLPLWVFATFVAYLVPAIPFLIWLAAIAGWVVLTLESVMAAPIWLVGHALPEGEGFAGLHARAGYLLLLGVLLRPCLLVLALFVCLLVMRATGSIIGALCVPFIEAQAGLDPIGLGLVGCLFLFVIISAAITLLTWKLFEVVTKIPDRILRWLGQQMASLGNEGATAMGLGAFQKAQNHAQGLAQSSARLFMEKAWLAHGRVTKTSHNATKSHGHFAQTSLRKPLTKSES